MDTPRYQSHYCEENIWHLCESFPEHEAYVLIIAGEGEGVLFWNQHACEEPKHPIAWDYHVILIVNAGIWLVYDFDSTLPCPIELEDYLAGTFVDLPDEYAEFAPRFRLLPAAEYRSTLNTDRSHMRTEDGGWHAPPPEWPPIGEGSNLIQLTDMTLADPGEILTLDQLRSRFNQTKDSPCPPDSSP